jgi:hypothetical protein
LHFGKTEIFLQMGLDKAKTRGVPDLPVGQNQSVGFVPESRRIRVAAKRREGPEAYILQCPHAPSICEIRPPNAVGTLSKSATPKRE